MDILQSVVNTDQRTGAPQKKRPLDEDEKNTNVSKKEQVKDKQTKRRKVKDSHKIYT